MQKRLSISDLPDDLLSSIFSRCSSKDIFTVSLVNSKWNQLANTNRVWGPIAERAFPNLKDAETNRPPKQTFQRRKRELANRRLNALRQARKRQMAESYGQYADKSLNFMRFALFVSWAITLICLNLMTFRLASVSWAFLAFILSVGFLFITLAICLQSCRRYPSTAFSVALLFLSLSLCLYGVCTRVHSYCAHTYTDFDRNDHFDKGHYPYMGVPLSAIPEYLTRHPVDVSQTGVKALYRSHTMKRRLELLPEMTDAPSGIRQHRSILTLVDFHYWDRPATHAPAMSNQCPREIMTRGPREFILPDDHTVQCPALPLYEVYLRSMSHRALNSSGIAPIPKPASLSSKGTSAKLSFVMAFVPKKWRPVLQLGQLLFRWWRSSEAKALERERRELHQMETLKWKRYNSLIHQVFPVVHVAKGNQNPVSGEDTTNFAYPKIESSVEIDSSPESIPLASDFEIAGTDGRMVPLLGQAPYVILPNPSYRMYKGLCGAKHYDGRMRMDEKRLSDLAAKWERSGTFRWFIPLGILALASVCIHVPHRNSSRMVVCTITLVAAFWINRICARADGRTQTHWGWILLPVLLAAILFTVFAVVNGIVVYKNQQRRRRRRRAPSSITSALLAAFFVCGGIICVSAIPLLTFYRSLTCILQGSACGGLEKKWVPGVIFTAYWLFPTGMVAFAK